MKQSDDKVPVMLELSKMRSIDLLLSIPGPLVRRGSSWLGPIYWANRTKLYTYAKLNCFMAQ